MGDFMCTDDDYDEDKDDDGDNDDYDDDDKNDDKDDNDVDNKNYGGQYNYDHNKDNHNNVNKTKQQYMCGFCIRILSAYYKSLSGFLYAGFGCNLLC